MQPNVEECWKLESPLSCRRAPSPVKLPARASSPTAALLVIRADSPSSGSADGSSSSKIGGFWRQQMSVHCKKVTLCTLLGLGSAFLLVWLLRTILSQLSERHHLAVFFVGNEEDQQDETGSLRHGVENGMDLLTKEGGLAEIGTPFFWRTEEGSYNTSQKAHQLAQDSAPSAHLSSAWSGEFLLKNATDDPLSRLFFFYVPYLGNGNAFGQLDEVFGAVESWRFVYGILEEPGSEPVVPTSQLHRYRSPTFDARKAFPKGVPFINDLLIVADPRVSDQSLPKICRLLSSNSDALYFAGEVERRLHTTVDSPATELARCYVIKTLLSSTQFQEKWNVHPAMNSVVALLDAAVVEFTMQYDLLLRSDNDCFLTPAINEPSFIPWRIPNRHRVLENGTMEEGGELKRADGDKTTTTQAVAPVGGNNTYALFVGGGGYSSWMTSRLLPEYAQMLGLRHQKMRSIGSSWYGRPEDLIAVGRLTLQVGEFLLENDEVFKAGGGEWPNWCRCVLLLYAGEIAVNHVIDRERLFIRPELLDSLSTTNRSLLLPEQLMGEKEEEEEHKQRKEGGEEAMASSSSSSSVAASAAIGGVNSKGQIGSSHAAPSASPIHIHCWHTPDFFSKHAFHDGIYTEAIFETPIYDVFTSSFYSFTNAWNGRKRRQLQTIDSQAAEALSKISDVIQSPSIGVPSSGDLLKTKRMDSTQLSHSLPIFFSRRIASIESSMFVCPESHPFPYTAITGPYKSYCCASPMTCLSETLKADSECCFKHQWKPCGASGCKVNAKGIAVYLHSKAAREEDTTRRSLKQYVSHLPAAERWSLAAQIGTEDAKELIG